MKTLTARLLAVTCALVAPVLMNGCKSSPVISAQERADIEQQIRQTDQQWAKASAAHSLDGWVGYYASDAVVLPPNAKSMDDPASIRAFISTLLALPNLQLSWRDTKVVVADAGDMAYLYGTYALHANDPSGAPISDTGKIAEIWRKQPDGAWRCVLDTWSSDLPAPAPSKP